MEFHIIVSFLELIPSLNNLSKHNEHNKYPFFLINNSLDLSISILQIEHLKIGIKFNENTYRRIFYCMQLAMIED